MSLKSISWREYDAYVASMRNVKTVFDIANVNVRCIGDENTVAKIQSDIIDIGTSIEKKLEMAGIDDGGSIKALEELCEYLYQWYESVGDIKIDYRDKILNSFDKFFHAFRRCHGKNTLAIGAIIKNEARTIEEWIEYHIEYGVSMFYIYDNGSTDNVREILKPYISEGIVEYIYWPGEQAQLGAYNDAIARHREDTGFIAFIDADEFLTPVGDELLPDAFEDIFLLNSQAGAIGVNWRVYGSSGIQKYEDGLVIEKFVNRAEDRDSRNHHVKSIINPRFTVEYVSTPHAPLMIQGSCIISENGTPIVSPWFRETDCERLRINHYYTKSKEEYFEKNRRGWPDRPYYTPPDIDIEYIFNQEEVWFNKVFDDSGAVKAEIIKERIRIRRESSK